MKYNILINPQKKPIDTVLYNSAVLFELLKGKKYLLDSLYKKILLMNENITYETYLLSLNFLFLLGKIDFNENGELACI